ncbi:MAG: tetratricopeptide repeat protein [Pseudomonadota bacterium]
MFVVLAALAVLVGLVFALLPLFVGDPEQRRLKRRLSALDELADELAPEDLAARRERLNAAIKDAPGGSNSLGLLIGLLIAIPAATVVLYRTVGEPEGLSRDTSQVHIIRDALTEIAQSLERNPEQPELWAQLGMSYKDLQQFSSAEHAFRRALYIDNGNPFIQVELAETLLFASGTSTLPDEAVNLLQDAAITDPQNQKALWLLGIHAYQAGNYAQAIARWQALDALLPEGSVRNSIREQIDRASQAMGRGPLASPALPPNHPPVAQSTEPAAAGPVFPVEVRISDALADTLTGSETVFLIARAANGPPAPLAVRRFTVSDLPYQADLSDADSMMEGLTLSAFPEVRITARVSMSGRPEPQAGDLQGEIGPLSILETPGAALTIDQVL